MKRIVTIKARCPETGLYVTLSAVINSGHPLNGRELMTRGEMESTTRAVADDLLDILPCIRYAHLRKIDGRLK